MIMLYSYIFFFFKQNTAYEMRISDWSSDVCSSDLCWNAEFIVEGAAGALETISIILLLLLAVILSGILSRVVPLPLPRPLFQIALGAVIGLAADWRVTLDPEIFFLLFLPPLLFLDGWRIPREEFFKAGKNILKLYLGLGVLHF